MFEELVKVALLFAVVGGLLYGCNRLTQPDTDTPIVSYNIYDNYVTRAEADKASCIHLNTNFGKDGNGTVFSNGTFDLIDGRPVCGLRADIVTTDGKKYIAFFNRFNAEPSQRYHTQQDYDAAISNGSVACHKKSRGMKCYAGDHSFWNGLSKEVHGPF